MRRRMLVIALPLLTMLLLALMVPLLFAYAADRTQDQFVGRLGDVARFAVLAEDAIELDETTPLAGELDRYTQVYGGGVVVIDANGEIVASAGEVPEGARTQAAVTRALTGATSQPPETAWPWQAETMRVGSPVGRDAQVLGAVIVIAPTDDVRHDVSLRLAAMAVAVLGMLLLTAYVVIRPLVEWVLRPVHALDRTATRLSAGEMDARASETGPTELRELARSFNDMADHVQASQAQQRELVADAAHQLGNPLTALRLRVEGLAHSGVDHDEIEPVLDETDRLSATVESLLHLSRVGASRVAPEPTDVAAQVRQRCRMWTPVFDHLTLEATGEVTAMAAPGIVDLAMDALLDNAAKFAPGSPVEVSVTPFAGKACVRVVDHGPGLHPDDIAKVGARFFRGRTHQNVPGTGLGLAIVRARLTEYGGDVEVSATEGGGLSVTLSLPATASAG